MQLEACRLAKLTDVDCCAWLSYHAPEIRESNVAHYAPLLSFSKAVDIFEILLEVILVETHVSFRPFGGSKDLRESARARFPVSS